MFVFSNGIFYLFVENFVCVECILAAPIYLFFEDFTCIECVLVPLPSPIYSEHPNTSPFQLHIFFLIEACNSSPFIFFLGGGGILTDLILIYLLQVCADGYMCCEFVCACQAPRTALHSSSHSLAPTFFSLLPWCSLSLLRCGD